MQVTIIAPNGIFYGKVVDKTSNLNTSFDRWLGIKTDINGRKTAMIQYKNQYHSGYFPNIDTEYWSEDGQNLVNSTVFVDVTL